MQRCLTAAELATHREACLQFRLQFWAARGQVVDVFKRETYYRFLAAGACLHSVVGEFDDTGHFRRPLAHIVAWLTHEQSYHQYLSIIPQPVTANAGPFDPQDESRYHHEDQLEPWRPGSGPATLYPFSVISAAWQGVLRMMPDMLAQLETHPARPHLHRLFALSDTGDGQLLAQLCGLQPSGILYAGTYPHFVLEGPDLLARLNRAMGDYSGLLSDPRPFAEARARARQRA